MKDSILAIVKRRLFAFPSAKRETEQGYHDACIKSALAQERNMLMAELNAQDVFGDIIRQLRQRAEQLSDTFSQFSQDLVNAVEDLAIEGRRVVDFTLTDAKRHEFLPTDYVTEEIRALKKLCGERVLKVIIETCFLTEEEKIAACKCVTEAGADFIKTSTGFGSAGATLEDIKLFKAHIGEGVQMKAAGGIHTREEMEAFIEAGCTRLGASAAVKVLKDEI
jgi:putative N-acetylmannosamine-6-phosphate epimerase